MSDLGKYQLPKGWAWATIPDITGKAGVFIDGDWVESKDQDPEGDVRLIQLADVGDGVYRDKSNRYMTKTKAEQLGCTFLKEGDVLIARMPDPLGRACIFPGDAKPAVTVVDVAIARSSNGEFDHRWLACFVNAHPFRSAIFGLQAGSTRKRISRGNLATIPLPVPPRDEQRRIVAEIEKQFTRLEAGVSALKRVQANLKRYRAAVLKAACEGRIFPSDLSAWKQLKVWEIGEAITGNTPPTSDEENLGDELPFFKPTDLDAGYNVREARQYLSAKGAKLSRVLPAGAVLVTCIGATIGKTGFARVDCATNQQINALVVNPQIAIPQWAFLLFSSPVGQQQIKNNASATTLPILNKSKFSALEFPIPPLAEQVRIVAEVERRLSVVEELEAVVSANLQRATRLRQSILQKAFTGELVSGISPTIKQHKG
jgi:type I restriction enzyme S subunit